MEDVVLDEERVEEIAVLLAAEVEVMSRRVSSTRRARGTIHSVNLIMIN